MTPAPAAALYAVAAIPKPRAPVAAWLGELQACGPLSRDDARAYAAELKRALGDDSSYTVRTFVLTPKEQVSQ